MSGKQRAAAADGDAPAARRPSRGYRDLLAWQRGMTLARDVYVFASSLPDVERYALAAQMRRAASSIPLNIAEGYAVDSPGAFVRHLKIAKGSLAELSTAIELATMLGHIQPGYELAERVEELSRIVYGLIHSITSEGGDADS